MVMMGLVQYDSRLTPKPFGLHNPGVLCWVNSLIQCMLSLPAFNKFLLDHKNKFISERNALGLHLLELLRGVGSVGSVGSSERIAVELARKQYLALGQQQDAHEGYQLLLNCIINDTHHDPIDIRANSLEEQFHIRHDTIISCKNCKSKRVVQHENNAGEPPTIFIDIPYRDPHHGRIDTQEKVQSYINNRSEFREGHRCETCDAVNTKDERVIVTSTVLRRLSSVITVVFKNYPQYTRTGSKLKHYFPQELEFNAKGNALLVYRPVAKIEHLGSESGGHYFAVCERHSRQYKMNDSLTTPVDAVITPTENTYMVFYHLM